MGAACLLFSNLLLLIEHTSAFHYGTLYRWHEAFREVSAVYSGIVQSRFHLERLCLSPFSATRKVRICTHLHDPVSAYLPGSP